MKHAKNGVEAGCYCCDSLIETFLGYNTLELQEHCKIAFLLYQDSKGGPSIGKIAVNGVLTMATLGLGPMVACNAMPCEKGFRHSYTKIR